MNGGAAPATESPDLDAAGVPAAGAPGADITVAGDLPVDPAADPGLPSRLLDDVLSRPEFTVQVSEGRNPIAETLQQLAALWSHLPPWVDAVLSGVIIAAAVALVLWLLADVGLFGRRRRRAAGPDSPVAASAPRGPSASALYREGRAAHAEGRHADAVVLLFRAMIARLVERGLLLDDASRTNREHLRDLRRREREARAVRAVVPVFERVRYGEAAAEAAEAGEALAAAHTLFPAEPR